MRVALPALVAVVSACATAVHSPPAAIAAARSPGLVVSRAADAPPLQEVDFERWRAYLAPRPDEEAWTQIPWRTTLAEGIRAAGVEAKPLLVWVMNGHPLGCT